MPIGHHFKACMAFFASGALHYKLQFFAKYSVSEPLDSVEEAILNL